MHCTNCGATVTDEWRHCSHCGAALPTEEHRQKAKAAGAGIREGWQSAAPYSAEEIETQRALVEEALEAVWEAHERDPKRDDELARGCLRAGVPFFVAFALLGFAAGEVGLGVGSLVFAAFGYIITLRPSAPAAPEKSRDPAALRTFRAVREPIEAELARYDADSARLAEMERQVAAYERAQPKRGS